MELAREVGVTLQANGISVVTEQQDHLEHGSWIATHLLWERPPAPVVMVSLYGETHPPSLPISRSERFCRASHRRQPGKTAHRTWRSAGRCSRSAAPDSPSFAVAGRRTIRRTAIPRADPQASWSFTTTIVAVGPRNDPHTFESKTSTTTLVAD